MAGEKREEDHKFTGRRLKMDDPRVVENYIQGVKKEVKKRKLHDWAQKLRKEIREGQTSDEKFQEVETLIEILYKIMVKAEKKCRKIKRGRIQSVSYTHLTLPTIYSV